MTHGRPKPPGDKRPRRDAPTKLGVIASKLRHARPAGQDLLGQIVLDRYLVEAELGSGAMATVYRGRHVKLDRDVAIKVLHRELVHDRRMRARFEPEAAAAARGRDPADAQVRLGRTDVERALAAVCLPSYSAGR